MPLFFAKVRAVIAELKRRHVFRVAVVYAVVTWMIIDPASTIMPEILGEKLGSAVVAIIILLAIFGFPIALVLAWAYETTPGGLKLEEPSERFQIELPPGYRPHEEAGSHNSTETSFMVPLAAVFGTLCVVFLLGTWITWHYFGTASDVWAAGNGSVPQKPIVAVTPFEMVAEDQSEYSAEWMTEAVIRGLRAVPEVMVSTPYRNFGGQAGGGITNSVALRPEALITGKVIKRREADVTEVGIVLRQKPNYHLHQWAPVYRFEGKMQVGDVTRIQSELAKEVARLLEVELTASAKKEIQQKPTEDFGAYKKDLKATYLRARYHWNRRNIEDIRESIELYKSAIEEDPGYALAYSGLADAYILLGYLGAKPPKEAYEQAEENAKEALSKGGPSAQAYNALAYVHFAYHWQWKRADRLFQKALKTDPTYATGHHWYGWYLTVMGEFEDGMDHLRRAIESKRKVPKILHVDKGWCHYFADEWEEAIAEYEDVLSDDDDFAMAHTGLGLVHVERQEYDKAIKELKEAVRLSESSPFNRSALGYAYAAAGRTEQAKNILNELKQLRENPDEYLPAAFIAKVHAGLENPEIALEWLKKAYESRSEYLTTLRVDPVYDRIRDHSGFQALTERVGDNGLPELND